MERYDAAKLLRSFSQPVRLKFILNSVSNHCFLAHVELDKEVFAVWNQVL